MYTETLKTQVEELEREKLELLENSKVYIKELKKTNESLFTQLHSRHHKPNSPSKSKHNQSLSNCKPRHEKSIKEIIKTEYIDRDRSGSNNKKSRKKKFGIYSTISGHSGDYKDNVKTFQVIGSSGKKDKVTASKKKNKHVFSNFTLINYLDSNQKRRKERGKSAGKNKKETTRTKSKLFCRDKKVNKSIFSVPEIDPNSNSKK